MKKIKQRKPNTAKHEADNLNDFLKIQLFAVIIYAVLFLTGTFLALTADLSSGYDYIFSLIIFAISSFAVGFFSGIKIRKNGLVIGVVYTMPMNIIISLISLILNDFTVGISLPLTLIILCLSGAVGGIFAVNKRIRR